MSSNAKLQEIQGDLSRLYDLELGARVEDYVCDEEAARDAVGAHVERHEVLLVSEEPGGDIAVGLYVCEEAVKRLHGAHDAWIDDEDFAAACLATEGVSHFVYFMYRALQDIPVSQLELELQAEVDKYASGLLRGMGVGLIEQRVRLSRERSQHLRSKLFERVSFVDEAHTEEGERYRMANRLAARYAGWLEETFVAVGDVEGLHTELRRFYRLTGEAKRRAATDAG